jgi:hypothetical protein
MDEDRRPKIQKISKQNGLRMKGTIGEIWGLCGFLNCIMTEGRPRRRWVDNIRMDLGEAGWGDVDWIGLAQDRNRWRALVNAVLNLRAP